MSQYLRSRTCFGLWLAYLPQIWCKSLPTLGTRRYKIAPWNEPRIVLILPARSAAPHKTYQRFVLLNWTC